MSDRVEPPRAIWIVAPVAVAMALLLLLLATREAATDRDTESSLAGELAPAIQATTIDGEPFDLDRQRGRFVVVNFFSTTCVPCIIEHPELVEFHEANAPSGIAEVVSVAFDDTEDNIREFFAENGGDWPIIADGAAEIAVDYGIPLVPESVIVADTGEVIEKLIGGVTREDLEGVIANFLAERETAT